MHPFDDNYLSKMSPEFEKKTRTEAPAPPPPAKPAKAAAEPETSRLFDSITPYILEALPTADTSNGTTKKAFARNSATATPL